MPFLMGGQPPPNTSPTGTRTSALVGKDNGAVGLTVLNAGIDPGAGLEPHIHPNYEEVFLVLEGEIEGLLGEETRTLGPGDALFAPAGTKHTVRNRSTEPAKVIAIYPTTSPKRTFV